MQWVVFGCNTAITRPTHHETKGWDALLLNRSRNPCIGKTTSKIEP
jgi:hypothetical protein